MFIFFILNKPGTHFVPTLLFSSSPRSWTICPPSLPPSQTVTSSPSSAIVRPQQRPSSVVATVNVAWSFPGASILLGTSGTHPLSPPIVRTLQTLFSKETYRRTPVFLSLLKTVLASRQLAPTCPDRSL
jgi:hypothetical protein